MNHYLTKAIEADPIYEEYENHKFKDIFKEEFLFFYIINYGAMSETPLDSVAFREDMTISFSSLKELLGLGNAKSYSDFPSSFFRQNFNPISSWHDINPVLSYFISKSKNCILDIYDLNNCNNSYHNGELNCNLIDLNQLNEYRNETALSVPLVILDRNLEYCIYKPISLAFSLYIIALKEQLPKEVENNIMFVDSNTNIDVFRIK